VRVSLNHNFIVTGGSDNFVRIWSVDSSELLFDFALDSQVTGIAVNQEDLILVSTLNGSLGSINIQHKLYKSLVRSHTDRVVGLDYNPTKRVLLSLGLDQTIRLWDCRNKMSQCYEFQCLDAQPLVISSYHLNPYVLVGFKGGLVRVFDIQSNIFVKELNEAESDILVIKISHDDQFFVVAEAAGSLYIYDGQLEFRRRLLVEYEADNFCLDIDYYCQSMIVSKNPFSLLLFSTNTWEIKQKVNVGEEIFKAKFSYLKDKLLVLTKSGKLKFYMVSYYDVEFLKDFGCLHDGGVADFEVSLNCAYIFTIGRIDGNVKVWDYHFRGNLIPAFQCFSVNESPEFLKISNDEQGFVFSAGGNVINTWMFKNSFEDMKLKAHAEEIQKRENMLLELEKSPPIFHSPAINQSKDVLMGGVLPKKLQDEQGHIVGELFKNMSRPIEVSKPDIVGETATTRLPSSTERAKNVRFKETYLTLDEEKQKKDKDFIDQEYEAIINPTVTSIPKHQDASLTPKEGAEVIQKGKEDYNKYAHEMIKPEYIHGLQGMEKGSLRWDQKNECYFLTCSNKIVANAFNEEESQTILENVFMDNIKNLALSSNSKYLVATMDAARSEPSSGFSVYDGRTHTRLYSTRINTAERMISTEISQKEDHLLLVFKPFDTEYSFVQIWDLLNNRRVVESAINDQMIASKWNPYGIHQNEFVTISASKIYFWRLSRNNTLQYQTILINDQGGRVDKEYTALSFFELSDQFKSCIIILGTSHGGLIFVDARSAVVLGYLNSALNESIVTIECNLKVVNISGKSPNIYSYFIPEESHKNLAKFLATFELSPQIMSLDGKIGCIHFPQGNGGIEGLATTSAGSVWYLNWKDRLTIKLKSWHWYQKKLLCMDFSPEHGKVFTAAADYAVKVFSTVKNEEEVEFFVPNKGCLSMTTSGDTLVCGFTDGSLR
jgi:WD40 repeat protein